MKIKIPLAHVMPTGAFSLVMFENKKYVVPAWKEVPITTTREDIEIIYPDKHVNVQEYNTYQVKGSGDNEYTVVIDSVKGNTCTCTGFSFRRYCKHINQVINQTKK